MKKLMNKKDEKIIVVFTYLNVPIFICKLLKYEKQAQIK